MLMAVAWPWLSPFVELGPGFGIHISIDHVDAGGIGDRFDFLAHSRTHEERNFPQGLFSFVAPLHALINLRLKKRLKDAVLEGRHL